MGLKKLKEQYEKLGEEIKTFEDNNPDKWYKIFAPMWLDNDGNCTRYEVSYICGELLEDVDDCTIMETYSDKNQMLLKIKKG
jgi:hypothetical protein